MLKQVYRIIILIAVFIASIFYFSRDIKEVVFDINNITTMEETTFPVVTIRTEEEELNLLHGYSSNLDANKVWEGVTPLGTDQSFEVIIKQQEYEIKKLNYEVREFVGNKLVESDSVSVFEENGNEKSAKIKLKAELELDQDYAVKITLITSESKKMFFYQRVKRSENTNLSEKLDFVRSFHNALKYKDTAEWIRDRLESNPRKDNSSLARVDINSSYDLVTWGNLNPVFLTKVIPTITEINTNFASVRLDYVIEAEIAGVNELFQVKEFYRVQYTRNKNYLLKYERTMEALFDTKLASVSMNQLKLGITNQTEVPAYLASPDQKKIAFVRNRELWHYNLENNQMTRVFSFRQENTDYIRDLYDQHDIRILNMDAEGNIDFIVYGYMNRGQYEGKVAVILYNYIMVDNRIEEKVYIPLDESYQTLKEKMGSLAYVNASEEFYLQMFDHIYTYNLITRQAKELASGVSKDQVVFLKDKGYVAWQGDSDPKQSKEIYIMELETGELQTINTRAGYNILLMDTIDSNLVYGFVAENDITTQVDGRTIIPMRMIEIASIDKVILKSYQKEGYFVTDLLVKENIIELDRVQKIDTAEGFNFVTASQDYIMNQVKAKNSIISIWPRITEQALTEYYLGMPTGFQMEGIPDIKYTDHAVISEDPTLRLPETEQRLSYYALVEGEIQKSYEEASEAIEAVKNEAGVVLDSFNRIVWEQGVRLSKNVITGYDNMQIEQTVKSLDRCIALMAKSMGKNVNDNQIDLSSKSIYEILKELTGQQPVRLTGAALEDVLYYVSEGKPVIALTGPDSAVLIYGYDAFNIHVVDPKQGKVRKIGLQDSQNMFEQAGSVYISYLDQYTR